MIIPIIGYFIASYILEKKSILLGFIAYITTFILHIAQIKIFRFKRYEMLAIEYTVTVFLTLCILLIMKACIKSNRKSLTNGSN